MPSQKCIDNVNGQPPPYNVWCGNDVCAKAQSVIDTHCDHDHHNPDDAWNIFNAVTGEWCSCCCSCYGLDTPIEARPGAFVKVQDIRPGDTILAAGPGLNWASARVVYAGGMKTSPTSTALFPLLKVIYRFDAHDLRQLMVTDDTLFLMKTGKLKSASALVPGDKLVRAHGGTADVVGPVTKSSGHGVYSIEMGPFDGVHLDGHLLNSNGVVTADLSVQRDYSSGHLTNLHLIEEISLDPRALAAGTEEYIAKFAPTQQLLDEIAGSGIKLDPDALLPPRPMITVPRDARGFVQIDQARDIRATAPFISSTNTFRIALAEQIISLAKSVSNDVSVLVDWNNSTPNAFAWSQLRQNFVVLAGGLLRFKPLTDAGMSFILADMLAYHAGAECVGEADREAVNIMRRMWPNSVFPMMCQRGVEEVAKLFTYVSADGAKEDPDNRCDRPSLDCRHKVFFAEMGAQPTPECAGLNDKPNDRKPKG